MDTRLNFRAVFKLAIPSMAFAILTHGYRVVDQYWSQGISMEAQAAIGSSFFVVLLFYSLFVVVAGGAGPLIARATGAGDDERRRRVLGASLTATVKITLLVMVIGTLGADGIAWSVGLSGDTAAAFVTYLQTLSLTILPLAMTPLMDQAFISMGDTRTPMKFQALSLALNIVLTPLFIYTLEMGIAGAAIASNLSRAISTGGGLWILWQRTGLTRAYLRDTSELRQVTRVGIPIGLGTASYAGVYVVLLYVAVSPLGPAYNAALGIGFSALESISWPAFHGVELALASLVGRALGARRLDVAWRAIRLTFPIFTLLGIGVTLIFVFFGESLTGLFTESAEVHAAATEYALVIGWSQLLVAWECQGEGILAGAGDSSLVFWLSTPFNLLRVPLSWWFAIHMGYGAVGIWWVINLTTLCKVAGKFMAVKHGRWTRLTL